MSHFSSASPYLKYYQEQLRSRHRPYRNLDVERSLRKGWRG